MRDAVGEAPGALETCRFESPIGTLVLTADGDTLQGVALGGTAAIAGVGHFSSSAVLSATCAQLEEYFAGRRRHFRLPLAIGGTPFQQAVWRALADISYGTTITYGELARRVGRPAAVRAVGQANGANRLPIVLPCHRVVAAGGRIGGYSGGVAMKRALLALEGVSALVGE